MCKSMLYVAVIYNANGFGLIMLLRWYIVKVFGSQFYRNLFEELINSFNRSERSVHLPYNLPLRHRAREGEQL